MEETLMERLNALSPMSDELKEAVRGHTKFIQCRPGDFILREGQVCNRACLIVKGLARSYYIIEDRDITSRFMDEGFIATSWMSFYTQQPGHEFIEALEETTLACLDYDVIQQLYKQFPEANAIGRQQVEYAFFMAEQRTQLLRKHTAEEKYKFFIDNHPSLLQRVSLKYIATYLGMNEETLSRVRSKYHKGKGN
jgi:CRP-like cAMP-binding protein